MFIEYLWYRAHVERKYYSSLKILTSQFWLELFNATNTNWNIHLGCWIPFLISHYKKCLNFNSIKFKNKNSGSEYMFNGNYHFSKKTHFNSFQFIAIHFHVYIFWFYIFSFGHGKHKHSPPQSHNYRRGILTLISNLRWGHDDMGNVQKDGFHS